MPADPVIHPIVAHLRASLDACGVLEYGKAEKPFLWAQSVEPAELTKLAEKIHDWLTVNGLGHFLVAAAYIPALKIASLSVAESPDHFTARALASAVQQGKRS